MNLAQLSSDRNAQDYGKVAVLLGGCSAERDVSLRSGEAIYRSLLKQGIDAVKIDPEEGLYQSLVSNQIERVFIALHGREGEDGVIQGFLQTLDIPFTGSNVAAAAVSMNKLTSKQIWVQQGIATAHFACVEKHDDFDEKQARRLIARLGPVLFVKPVKEGSSVGMSKATNPEALVEAVNLALQFDRQVLVESFIAGDEYTVSVVKDVALPSISMQTPREFYDYQAKYEEKTTEYFCPSGLSEQEEMQLQTIALKAFKGLGCSGWGRVDFIRNGVGGDFLILEANTVPGMTETSLVPKAAAAVGVNFDQLVLHILDTSFGQGG